MVLTDSKIIGTLTSFPIIGHFLVGLTLFYGVKKFFKEIEDILSDSFKFKIALGLVSVKPSRQAENLPSTFVTLFDRVFGSKHLSLRCFVRSSLASYIAVAFSATLGWLLRGYPELFIGRDHVNMTQNVVSTAVLYSLFLNIFPDYLSLLQTRWLLSVMRGTRSTARLVLLVLLNFYLTVTIGHIASQVGFFATLSRMYGSVGQTLTLSVSFADILTEALWHPLSGFGWHLIRCFGSTPLF